jgi:hypothetical protein
MLRSTKVEADALRKLHRRSAVGHLRESGLLVREARFASAFRRAVLLRQAALANYEAGLVAESDEARAEFLRAHPEARAKLGLDEKATARGAA